jgi:membrane fusion protein (multidrug efflux system)
VAKRTAEVFVIRTGRAEKRLVECGKATGTSVEIIRGVAAGDQVVTRGAFALRQGDRVTLTAAGEGD